jgi:N-methylhydantoinase B
VDAVTLAVLKGRLEQIADEMDATLYRAAFNPIIAEAHDASHGLYQADTGETLVQGKSGLPVFVGAMAFAVKLVIDTFGDSLHDGDVFIFNDAHRGGTHLNDMKLVRPFFYGGRLFCHLASVGHWHDVGGAVPGNYNPQATESLQEAFVLPCVRLINGKTAPGEVNQDLVRILQANSRLPMSVYGDLNGQIAALDVGHKRLTALLDSYGVDPVNQVFERLKMRASTLMRERISAIPDGVYSCDDALDNDGIDDVPLPVAVDIRVHGDTMTLDFSRTAKACAGPVNISKATAVAACYVALKHVFIDVPANSGVLEPIHILVDAPSILNAPEGKPVGGYTETILRMIDVIFGALSKAIPDQVSAMAYGTINALSLTGYRTDEKRLGQRWVMFSFFGGGHGGHSQGDGLSHGNAPISTATIPPLEILEAAYPVRFTQWALRPGSGGAGQYRGGLGAVYEIELLEQKADVFLFGERGRFAPQGVAGGGEAQKNVFQYENAGAWLTPPAVSKMVGIKLVQGERLRLETPGGGGWGPPPQRSQAAIERDRALGYI